MLRFYNFVKTYIDNIIIYFNILNEYISHLWIIFELFRQKKMSLILTKSFLDYFSITLLN